MILLLIGEVMAWLYRLFQQLCVGLQMFALNMTMAQVKNRGEKSDHFDFLEWEKGREADGSGFQGGGWAEYRL